MRALNEDVWLSPNSQRARANVCNLRRSFDKQRQAIAAKMGNPRLMQIHFHTLRHWKGTMEYARTKDILHVMQVLGHRRIQNTLKYTQLVHFDAPDDYVCKVAQTDQEIGVLIELGFEYICENQGLKFFQKAKVNSGFKIGRR